MIVKEKQRLHAVIKINANQNSKIYLAFANNNYCRQVYVCKYQLV